MTKGQVALITAALTSLFWMIIIGILGVAAAGFFVMQRAATEGVDFDFAPPPYTVSVSVPATCTVGDRIALQGTVTNPTEDRLKVNSIDIYTTYLEGFAIGTMVPAASSTDDFDDFHTFWMQHDLPPGAVLEFSLDLTAAKPGTYSGDVDICDENENFVTEVVTTVIAPVEE